MGRPPPLSLQRRPYEPRAVTIPHRPPTKSTDKASTANTAAPFFIEINCHARGHLLELLREDFRSPHDFHSFHLARQCTLLLCLSLQKVVKPSKPSNLTALGTAQLCHDGSSVKTPMFVELFAIRDADNDRLGSSVVAVNGMAAVNAGFENEQQIIVQLLPNLPTCTRIEVEPLSSNDWEIIQYSAGRIEHTFFDQIKVVQTGMVFPFWVERNISVMFRILGFDPNVPDGAAVVSQSAEIIVAPPPSAGQPPTRATISTISTISPIVQTRPKLENVKEKETSSSSLLHRLMSNFSANPQANDPADSAAFRVFIDGVGDDGADPLTYRVLPRSLTETELTAINKTVESLNPTAVYALSDPASTTTKINSFVGLIRRENERKTAVLIVILPRCLVCSLSEYAWIAKCLEKRGRHAIVANETRLAARVDDLSWITCKPVAKSEMMLINKLIVEVNPGAKTDQLVSRLFQTLRGKCGSFPLVLTKDGFELSVILEDGSVTDCKLKPDIQDEGTQDNVFLLFLDSLPSTTVTESEGESDGSTPIDESGKLNFAESLFKAHVLHCQAAPVAESARFIEWALRSETAVGRHVLLCGPASSGKTSMAYRICSRLFRGPATVFSYRLDCRTLRGKNVESVKKRLNVALDICKQRRPSVLVLDDLDQLCSTPNAVEELNPGSDIATERLVKAVWSCVDAAQVLVLATSRSTHSLHSTLVAPRGRHFFGFRRFIEPLDHADRSDALRTLLAEEMGNGVDVEAAAKRCDGFVVGDLWRVVRRAVLQTTVRGDNVLTDEHLLPAIDASRPVGQRTVQRVHNGDEARKWDEVGGMTEVRLVLTQVLLWPLQYPHLFSSCPIRVSRGVLLHGPSGCGKTLIASVVAAESKLNFIAVKGPELLSKYIGASEQSVRDTFERARSSKPCLIFFDEFDALAPRRGHDSTGVTDRVVNQLLTELDGVEQLQGVFVLAATSRPDLLDPALLRPGRLDRLLFCGPPNLKDRRDILTALTKNLRLEDSVQLDKLAQASDGWTGADLKALVTNAQMNAVHRLQKSGGLKRLNEGELISIDEIDFNASLQETTSKTAEDAARLSRRDHYFPVGQRVTLA